MSKIKMAAWLGGVVPLLLAYHGAWAADVAEVAAGASSDWNTAAAWSDSTLPSGGNNYLTTTVASVPNTSFGVSTIGRLRDNDAVNPNVFSGGTLMISANTLLLIKQIGGESASANIILNGGMMFVANNSTAGGINTFSGTISNTANSYLMIQAHAIPVPATQTFKITSALSGANNLTLVSGVVEGAFINSGATNLIFWFTGDLSAFTGTLTVGNAATSNEVLELNPSSTSLPSLSLVVRSNTTLQLDTAITIASLTIFQTAASVAQVVPTGTYTASQLAALGFGGNFTGAGSVTVTVSAIPPQTSTPVIAPSGTVVAGTVVTLTETVTLGSTPFSYQWRSNGVATGTAVASSAFTNALVVNTAGMLLGSYNYSVVVTNLYGYSTSAPVTLNIVAPVDYYEVAAGAGVDWNDATAWSSGAIPSAGNNYITTTNAVAATSLFGVSTIGRVRDNDPSRGAPNPNVFSGGTLTVSANTELLVKQTNGQSASASIILNGGVIRWGADGFVGIAGTNSFGGAISNAADSCLAISGVPVASPQTFNLTSALSGANNLTLVSGSLTNSAATNLTFLFTGDLSAFSGTITVGNAVTSGEILELNPANTNMASAALLMASGTTLQLDERVVLGSLSISNVASGAMAVVPLGNYTASQLAALGLGGSFLGAGSLHILTNWVAIAPKDHTIAYWKMSGLVTDLAENPINGTGILDLATNIGAGAQNGSASNNAVAASVDNLFVTGATLPGNMFFVSVVPPPSMFNTNYNAGPNSWDAGANQYDSGEVYFPQDVYGNELVTPSFTEEIFFKSDAQSTNKQALIWNHQNSAYSMLELNESADTDTNEIGNLLFWGWNGTAFPSVRITAAQNGGQRFDDGTWHYAACRFDAAIQKMSLLVVNEDGSTVVVSQTSTAALNPGTANDTIIGNSQSLNEPYNGLINQLRMSGVALADPQLLAPVVTATVTPHISSIAVSGGTVTIVFTGSPTDSASAFSLIGSVTLKGTYANLSATIIALGAGNFQATVAVSGATHFYRIQR